MEKIIFNQIHSNLEKIRNQPLFVAIHGPQGSGKSSTCLNIKEKLDSMNYNCLIVSLDDFYYPYSKMQEMLFEFNDKLYKYRGLAGTHDIEWLQDFLKKIKKGKNAVLPKFNKSLHGGFGDIDDLIPIYIKYDVVIFEGWMIGYKPRKYIPAYLRKFNDQLKKYQFLHEIFDLWFYFETDLQNTYNWRYSAETKMNKETFDEFMKPYFIIYSNYFISKNENKYILDKERNVIQ